MDEKIKYFCQKWNIREFSLFGSSVTGKANDESDIDIMVSFNAEAHYGFFELVEMKDELEVIYGKKVDLVTQKGVESSRNYIRVNSILKNKKLVYG